MKIEDLRCEFEQFGVPTELPAMQMTLRRLKALQERLEPLREIQYYFPCDHEDEALTVIQDLDHVIWKLEQDVARKAGIKPKI